MCICKFYILVNINSVFLLTLLCFVDENFRVKVLLAGLTLIIITDRTISSGATACQKVKLK